MKYQGWTIDQQVSDLARSASETVHKKFGDYVDLEDLTQECWAWYLVHQEQADNWLKTNRWGLLRYRMRLAAHRYARKVKAGASYSTEDEVFYAPRAILELLPEALDPQATPRQEASETGRVSGASKVGYDEWNVTIADIRSAYDKLPAADRELLMYHCGYGYSPDALGVHYGLPTDVVYKRLGRALRRMRGRLGGANPWT